MAFAACKHKVGRLSPKEMKKVLVDIHLAESYCTIVRDSLHKDGGKNYDSLQVYYKRIFNHYKITPQQFTESMDWYKAHPTELDSLYADIQPAVNSMQQSANKKK